MAFYYNFYAQVTLKYCDMERFYFCHQTEELGCLFVCLFVIGDDICWPLTYLEEVQINIFPVIL